MIRCDVCGAVKQDGDRRRWTSTSYPGGATMRCPKCQQLEADAKRAEQREPKYSEPPPVWRGWGR